MLDINFIKNNLDLVRKGIANKGYDPSLVDQVIKVNSQRLELLSQVEQLRQEKNEQSSCYHNQLTKEDQEKGRGIKIKLDELEPKLNDTEEEIKKLLLNIPNIPSPDVPIGKDETENVVLKKWGEPQKFDFPVKDHLEIGERLDIIDVERARKVSGSRFFYLKNEGVILEMALMRLAFDSLVKEGFHPVIPPVLITLESMAEMGYLGSEGREDMYILDKDGLVLVGTSEQSIGPMHKEENLNKKDLPLRYVGFSTCFRREAGSYGKDIKGILRVHQFNKVEMFVYSKPEDSDREHEYLLSIEEKLMQTLSLPYQVVKICTGDLGITAAKKYDIETWFPAQVVYRETHSSSNCTDFQARGIKTKYKEGDKTDYVHTLNGTVFSERPLIAILENFQQADGSVKIPEVLQKYTGFAKIKPKN